MKGCFRMKKIIRYISLLLGIVIIVSVLSSVAAFADVSGGKPGPDDIKGASKYLVAPKDESWLDAYQKGYVYAPEFGRAAYRYMSSRTADHMKTVPQGTEVTLLAKERTRFLVKTESGDIFWLAESCCSDRYIAPGRAKTGNADVDANGPNLNDLEGIRADVDRPGMNEWLDERVECYVYAPKHHRGAEMLYYIYPPKTPAAIKNGYDIYRRMGTVNQGTAITLLAHHGNRYLVKSEFGDIFWMYDWCTSDTRVPYGEAK